MASSPSRARRCEIARHRDQRCATRHRHEREWLRYYIAAKLNGASRSRLTPRIRGARQQRSDRQVRQHRQRAAKLLPVTSRRFGLPHRPSDAHRRGARSRRRSARQLRGARFAGPCALAWTLRTGSTSTSMPASLGDSKDPGKTAIPADVCSRVSTASSPVRAAAPVLPDLAAQVAQQLFGSSTVRWSDARFGRSASTLSALMTRVDPKQLMRSSTATRAAPAYGRCGRRQDGPAASAGDTRALRHPSMSSTARPARGAHRHTRNRRGADKLLKLTLDLGSERAPYSASSRPTSQALKGLSRSGCKPCAAQR